MIDDRWWFWQPKYILTLTDLYGVQYTIDTLATCQATLETDAGAVAQGVFTLNDPDWDIWRGLKPRAMWKVSLQLENRHGEWGPAWTGYVDAANKVDDPQSGQQVVLTCTSPAKLFEVKNQTPSQAASLTLAYALGVTGSAVLKYAAQKVGFPASQLVVDPTLDAGANTWGAVSTGDLSNPQSQSWMAVLQGLIADSGGEFFFDEEGKLHWRPIQYLNVPRTPRIVDLADVGHYDIGYQDRGVVTDIEVRYGAVPFHVAPSAAQAAYWQAPASMRRALGTRYVTITAPWIGSNQNGAAIYLAQALGQLYAANVGISTIVQVADPLFKLGTVVEIPSNDAREGSALGYLSRKVLNLQYNGPWLEIHGYSYCRAKGQSFPYGLAPTKPQPPTGPDAGFATPASGVPDVNLDATLTGNQIGRYQTPFTLVQDSSVAPGQATVDPSLGIAVGSQIQVWTSFGKGKQPVGNRATYTVVAANGTDGAIHLSQTGGVTTGYVVLVGLGSADSGASASPTGTSSGGTPSGPSTTTVPDPGAVTGASNQTPTAPFTFPLRGWTVKTIDITQFFGPTSFSAEPPMYGYPHFHTGVDFAAPNGNTVVAAIDGVVTSVGWYQTVDAADSQGVYQSGEHTIYFTGFGYNVSIRSGDITTHYGHMQDGSCSFQQNQAVAAGTPIGLEGSTGNSTGPHLHFGVFDHSKGVWVDPLTYLR